MSQGTFTEDQAEAKKIAAKKTEKSKRHRRHLSGSISKADWTEKIYVLVTSGYLMQYAAEGPFDRIPEKMLQLSKDSVVFASDAIPGELFVLVSVFQLFIIYERQLLEKSHGHMMKFQTISRYFSTLLTCKHKQGCTAVFQATRTELIFISTFS